MGPAQSHAAPACQSYPLACLEAWAAAELEDSDPDCLLPQVLGLTASACLPCGKEANFAATARYH